MRSTAASVKRLGRECQTEIAVLCVPRSPHSGKPVLRPGEYLAYQIGEKLQVSVSHSFLVSGGAVDTPTPGRGDGSVKPEASLETSTLSGAKEEL